MANQSTRSKKAAPGAKNKKSQAKNRNVVLRDEVLEALRYGLMRGHFIPNQVISLRKIAHAFGTSPMPVRDALSHLVALNVLETTAGRKVRVPRITKELVKELTEIRIAIESLAAKAAIKNVTPIFCEKLRTINDRLLEGIRERDLLACLDANWEFHFLIYEASQLHIVMPIIEGLWLRCGPTMYYSLLSPDVTWDASFHDLIIGGFENGDEMQVTEALSNDIRTTLESITTSKAPLNSADAFSSFLSSTDIHFG